MINLGKAQFGKEEIEAVTKVIETGWVGRGPQVIEFEKEFAKYCGAKFAIAVNGCTSALRLSLQRLGVGQGDEVIVPSLTWNATAAVVVQLGARPIWADVDPETGCMDPIDTLKLITKKTKAVIPVHYCGNFASGFENFPVPVIYDSAHRIEKNGFTGRTECYSFYVTKNITTVRGGMILTNDEEEAKWLRIARSSGIDKDVLKRYQNGDFYYEVDFPSVNLDMSDVEASIGRVQLSKIDLFNKRREEIVKKYNSAFGLSNQGNHLYTILVDNRDGFLAKMKEEGIQCGIHFLPLHLMRGYAKYKIRDLSWTEYIGQKTVSLPLFTQLTDQEIDKVILATKAHAKLVTELPRNRMRIVILDFDNLNNPNLNAGQARATFEVGRILARKHKVTVYCYKYPGCKDYSEEGMTYKHFGIDTPWIKLNNILYFLFLPFIVSRIRADIILDTFTAPVSATFTPLYTSTPVVGIPTSFQGSKFQEKYHLPISLIENLGCKLYRYFAPYTSEYDRKMKSMNPHVINRIIPEGVGDEFFDIKQKDPEHILFLGRFDMHQKGIDLLLKAYAKVVDKMNFPLVLAGHGPDTDRIAKLIEELNIGHRVKMIGSTYGEKKVDILSKSLFVAFPSRHEGFSLFSLEALASGLPLVGFDIPEFEWTDSSVHIKSKPFDVDSYAEILLKADNNLVEIYKMRLEARKFARQYSWENVAHKFEDFFFEILKHEALRVKSFIPVVK